MPTTTRRPRVAPLWRGPFRHRNYRLFWFGQLISLAGTWMQSIAQAWYITELTQEPAWLGIVAAAQFTPVMLLGLFGGVLADALPKHRALMGTQVSLMTLAFLQAVLVATGLMTLPLLILMAVLLGIVNAIDMPVRQSFFSEMVPEDEVGRAVAMNSAMFNGARVIGPAIGGVLIGVIGVAGCFAVNGASFLAVLLALLFMRASELRPAPRTPRPRTVADVLISLAEGVRFVARTPLIALCVFVIGVVSGVAMNFNVIVPTLARSVLQVGAPGLGILMAAIGFGSLSGALAVAMLRQPRTVVITAGAALLGVLSIAAGVVSGSGIEFAAVITGIALFGAGFGAIAMAATANASIQTSTPPALRGRVMSVYTTVFAGSTPIGGLGTGAVVSLIGAPGTLVVAGACALLATAYATVRWRNIL
jgi:MFS family permease